MKNTIIITLIIISILLVGCDPSGRAFFVEMDESGTIYDLLDNLDGTDVVIVLPPNPSPDPAVDQVISQFAGKHLISEYLEVGDEGADPSEGNRIFIEIDSTITSDAIIEVGLDPSGEGYDVMNLYIKARDGNALINAVSALYPEHLTAELEQTCVKMNSGVITSCTDTGTSRVIVARTLPDQEAGATDTYSLDVTVTPDAINSLNAFSVMERVPSGIEIISTSPTASQFSFGTHEELIWFFGPMALPVEPITTLTITIRPTSEITDPFVGNWEISVGENGGISGDNVINYVSSGGCVDEDVDGICAINDCDAGDITITGPGVDDDSDATTDACDDDDDGYLDSTIGGTDANDNDDQINPGMTEICDDNKDNDQDTYEDEFDDECTCFNTDKDGDTYIDELCGGNDCDDFDYNVNPIAIEDCTDTVDNDCDGKPDSQDEECQCTDIDGDQECADTDCDDQDILNFHGNSEICDGQDNNCDGVADEGCAPLGPTLKDNINKVRQRETQKNAVTTIGASRLDNRVAINVNGKTGTKDTLIVSGISDLCSQIDTQVDTIWAIGGPCANPISDFVYGYPSPCGDGFEVDTGYVRVESVELCGDGVMRDVIVVAGEDYARTRLLGNMIAKYELFTGGELDHNHFKVTGGVLWQFTTPADLTISEIQ